MAKKKVTDDDDDLFGLNLPPPPKVVSPPPPPPAPPKVVSPPPPPPPPPPKPVDTPEQAAVLKCFENWTREHGHHPRAMVVFPKLIAMVKKAKIREELLTPAFFAKAALATLPIAKEYAAKHNAAPKRLGYMEIVDATWLSWRAA